MARETILLRGHIIDSLLLPKVLDVILQFGGTFQIADVLLEASNPILFVTGAVGSIPEKYRQVPRLHKPFDDREFARLAKSIFRSR